MIGYFRAFTWLTYGNAIFGISGIVSALCGQLSMAMICLICAGVCDMFDGSVAKRMKRSDAEKIYGMQIDSFCDLLSFGMLPAIIGLCMGFRSTWEFALCICYVMAALIRLAYFNVTEIQNFYTQGGARTHYEGLPVTAVAAFLPLLYLLSISFGWPLVVLYRIALGAIAILFVSRLKVRKPRMKEMIVFGVLGIPTIMLLIHFMMLRGPR